jgi:hypothetical protein
MRVGNLPESSTVRQVRQVRQDVVVAAVAGGATGCLYRDTCSTTPTRPRDATAPETFTLTLRALPDPDDVPAVVRLRRVLKSLLRSYRFRCVDVRPSVVENSENAAPEAAA